MIELNGLPQILWPVHCVQNTRGAGVCSGTGSLGIAKVFQKGTDPAIDSYSGFFDNGHRKSTGMGQWLREQNVGEVLFCGLATDYCVKFTALDARQLGFKTTFIENASRGVELKPGDVSAAIEAMRQAGASVVRLND